MFTKKVTDDDNFMALSASAQALYLHLSMSADDDGFCNQVSISMFKAHASVQDLQALLEKRYIYQFENGVIVIKHWRMANALRKDRYTPTAFKEELSHLGLKDNGSYTWLPDGCQVVVDCLPQDSIGKDSIGKDIYILSNDNISQTHVRQIVAEWNTLSAYGIKQVSKIDSGSKRYSCLMARVKQYGYEDVIKAIDNIRHSDFLQGKHGGRQWQITFDWFVLPNNFPKVLEGNYNSSETYAHEDSRGDDRWQ